MRALWIKDELHWHDRWSSTLGASLETRDSSNNLLIFDEKHSREEILAFLAEAPREYYEILELTPATEEDFDFLADSGNCYRRLH